MLLNRNIPFEFKNFPGSSKNDIVIWINIFSRKYQPNLVDNKNVEMYVRFHAC